MIVTITEYARVATEQNGYPLPLGRQRLACQVRTSAGAFGALQSGTRFIRVATDTSLRMDLGGGSTDTSDELILGPGVEYFAVDGGETLAITVA